MSLNRFAQEVESPEDLDVYMYMNIGANWFKCNIAVVANLEVFDIQVENLEVENLTVLETANLIGANWPLNSTTTTAGYVLENVDGLGTLSWAPQNSGPGTDIVYGGALPTLIGEIALYNSADGQSLKDAGGVTLTDIQNDISDKLPLSGGTMTGIIDMNFNDIQNAADVKCSVLEASVQVLTDKVSPASGGEDLLLVNEGETSSITILDSGGLNIIGNINMNNDEINNISSLDCINFVASSTGSIRGNVFPSNITTPGWVLTNVDGFGNLQWAPDASGGDGVSYVDTPPTQVDEIVLYGSTDGEGIKNSGILESDLFLKDGSRSMTSNLNMGVNDIVNVNNIVANGNIETPNNISCGNLLYYSDASTKIEFTGSIDLYAVGNFNFSVSNTQVNCFATLDLHSNPLTFVSPSSGTNSFYERFTSSGNQFSGPYASPISQEFTVTRTGDNVSINLGSLSSASTINNPIVSSVALPISLRPQVGGTRIFIQCFDNSVSVLGNVLISNSTGLLTINPGVAGGGFTSSGSAGFNQASITYSTF